MNREFYDLIIAAKEDAVKAMDGIDINVIHDYNDAVIHLTKAVMRQKKPLTDRVNQEAALVTVLSLGLQMGKDGNIEFTIPSTKKCLEQLDKIRSAIFNDRITIINCYSNNDDSLIMHREHGSYWTVMKAEV